MKKIARSNRYWKPKGQDNSRGRGIRKRGWGGEKRKKKKIDHKDNFAFFEPLTALSPESKTAH